MLKDFNDTASLSDLGVLDDFFFEVGGANLFDICRLLYLLTLIEVMKLAIKELLDQPVQVFSDFVEEHDFSVLMNIRVRIVLLILLSTLVITLSNHRLSRLQTLALFGVHNDHIGEDLGEFLGIEQLRRLLLVASVIDVESFGVVLEDLLEFTDVA